MKILLLETIHADAVEMLGRVAETQLAGQLDEPSVTRDASNAVAIITRGRGRIHRTTLERSPLLKCVARCGAGTDNIDVSVATERGLPVIFSPDGTRFAVAEHAIMLAMAVGRRLVRVDREVKNGNWEVRNQIGISSELFGKTLGIVGLGRIGSRIAELGSAFGMRVRYWSAHSRDERFERVELETLFRDADVISVSLALTPETKGLIDARLIGLMKPSAILINTARGEVVDETALAESLANKRIAGAGLDVMAEEPPRADHPMFGFDNVVITPHIATITDVAYRRMCVEVAEQVIEVVTGGKPRREFVRNPQVLS